MQVGGKRGQAADAVCLLSCHEPGVVDVVLLLALLLQRPVVAASAVMF